MKLRTAGGSGNLWPTYTKTGVVPFAAVRMLGGETQLRRGLADESARNDL